MVQPVTPYMIERIGLLIGNSIVSMSGLLTKRQAALRYFAGQPFLFMGGGVFWGPKYFSLR